MLAPIGALVRKGGDWAIYRIVDGRARLTTVQIGAMDERHVELIKGVDPNTEIIVFPSDKIRDGVAVRAKKASDG